MTEINILVIEDNQEQAAVLEKTLLESGYKPWIVSEPNEGLKLLQNMSFAAVITELRSGKMNGIEVTQAVRKVSLDTNVIVMTFYSFIASAIEAMEAGAYGYITKPLNTSEIRVVLERAVERYALVSTTAEKNYYAELAIIDGLTGLYNRRYFKGVVEHEFSRLRRNGACLSFLMIDIDNFKIYNDTKGHPAGDELLKKAAEVFKGSVREEDVVCRYGGEEFVIMLPGTDKKGSQIVAERIRVQISLYISTTVSVGIATFPEDAPDSQSLLNKADGALYKAKQTGKNKWVCA